MIDYKYSSLYYEDSIHKYLTIKVDDGTVITNEDIFSESMSLEESLCSEESLTFGSCEASIFQIQIANQFSPLYGHQLTVSEVLSDNTDEPFQFGIYRVIEDTPTADREYRNITAYDALYDIINADTSDVAKWYESILPENDSTITMREFRTSFLSHFGIEEVEDDLINDSMIIEKTVEATELSGKTVINAICELNGCFGHINREGKFQYVHLGELTDETIDYVLSTGEEDVVLSDDNEAPIRVFSVKDEDNLETIVDNIQSSMYLSCTYQDFITQNITKLQIRQDEDDAGCTIGDGDNCYVLENNFLVYGKSTKELSKIASNLLSTMKVVAYRPATVTAIGNPCVEIGDGIKLETKYETIYSFVLHRNFVGIQSLSDTYEATGTEIFTNTGNSTSEALEQLKGKTNRLTRTVDETRSELEDFETGISSSIVQTADTILSTITGVADSWEYGSYDVTIIAYGEPSESGYDAENYDGEYCLDWETGEIYLSSGGQWVKKANCTAVSGGYATNSSIEQKLDSITLSVSGSSGTACIQLSVDGAVNSTVSSREAFAKETSAITISAGTITFTSNTIVIDSSNFSVTSNGVITAKSGTIGGWSLTSGKIYGGDGTTIPTAVMQMPSSNITWVFAAGGSSHDSYKDCPFRVNKSGEAYFYKAVHVGMDTSITEPSAKIRFDDNNGNQISYIEDIEGILTIHASSSVNISSTLSCTTVYGRGVVTLSGNGSRLIIDSPDSDNSIGLTVQGFTTGGNNYSIILEVGTGGVNRGLYDGTNGSWIVYRGQYYTYIQGEDGTCRAALCSRTASGTMVNYIGTNEANSSGYYYLTVNGDWGGTSGSGQTSQLASHNIVSSSSDIRLKENVSNSNVNALDVIDKIKIREFDWKQTGNHNKIGMIADELEEIDEALSVGGGEDEDGNPDYKSINTEHLLGYVVKGMQELNAKQEGKIAELEEDVQFLREELELLKSA